MRLNPSYRNVPSWFNGRNGQVFAAFLLSALLAKGAAAQPPSTVPPDGTQPPPSRLPEKTPKPLKEVQDFVEPLSTNDAVFEVLLGQSRILTVKDKMKVPALIAVGDPSIIDFQVLNERQVRILANHIGVTDLSIVTTDNRLYSFEVRVVADLDPLRLQLRATFPDASLKLSQFRDHIVIEGQARDTTQVARILDLVRAYLRSVFVQQARKITTKESAGGVPGGPVQPGGPGGAPRPEGVPPPRPEPGAETPPRAAAPGQGPRPDVEYQVPPPQLINLIRVPGSQQVLLKVRVAELNRTALREVGADLLALDTAGTVVGTQISNAHVVAQSVVASDMIRRVLRITPDTGDAITPTTTLFGIFEKGGFDVLLRVLRRNNLLKILAEPNLVALNGHQASFLAGGEFPVPVPQVSGGVASSITVLFKQFGVSLNFVPQILDDDTIRLTVDPEVSSIDFTVGVTLVVGGSPVPGLNSRKAHTTVELHQGQTLAIAGLLQLTLDGSTSRIPGLGDLPILGPFFSNTTGNRIEKELVVLVTPYLAEPMNPNQVPPGPGDEVKQPNDLEFYFLNRIEGRTGVDHRTTTNYDDPLHLIRCYLRLEKDHVRGPHGHCEEK
jgi:pilus assembly protein CpaC